MRGISRLNAPPPPPPPPPKFRRLPVWSSTIALLFQTRRECLGPSFVFDYSCKLWKLAMLVCLYTSEAAFVYGFRGRVSTSRRDLELWICVDVSRRWGAGRVRACMSSYRKRALTRRGVAAVSYTWAPCVKNCCTASAYGGSAICHLLKFYNLPSQSW